MEKSCEKFVQCRLDGAEGMSASLVMWVPIRFAEKGKKVDVKVGDRWHGPWIISEVYRVNYLTGEQLDSTGREYRYHRKRTDV